MSYLYNYLILITLLLSLLSVSNCQWPRAEVLVKGIQSSGSGGHRPRSTSGWSYDASRDDPWNWENPIGTDDEQVEMTSSIVEVIVFIVLGLVIFSFIGFLICICCPICILAKLRLRRRGHVYARQGAPTIATTITTHPTQGPQVIAVTNQRSNAPYPVQESVTVIPVITPQPLHMGPHQAIVNPMIASREPPPPYPGHADGQQLPFNPYFKDPSIGPTDTSSPIHAKK